jgi:hypothetical protein
MEDWEGLLGWLKGEGSVLALFSLGGEVLPKLVQNAFLYDRVESL